MLHIIFIKKGLKNTSIIRKATTVRGFYSYLNLNGYINISLIGFRLPKAEKGFLMF